MAIVDSNGKQMVEYKCNSDGLRVRKVATSTGTTNYTLHGKNVVHLTNGTNSLHFYYDAQNRPAVVEFNWVPYVYVHNLQGDIIAVVDGNGNKVVEYKYDAWGKPIAKTGSLANTLGTLNPFRYRGYVYDEETGLHYLRSRFFTATWNRLINADVIYTGNLFSYCSNMPTMRVDCTGKNSEHIMAADPFAILSPPVNLNMGQYLNDPGFLNINLTLIDWQYRITTLDQNAAFALDQEMKAQQAFSDAANSLADCIFEYLILRTYPYGLIKKAFEAHGAVSNLISAKDYFGEQWVNSGTYLTVAAVYKNENTGSYLLWTKTTSDVHSKLCTEGIRGIYLDQFDWDEALVLHAFSTGP